MTSDQVLFQNLLLHCLIKTEFLSNQYNFLRRMSNVTDTQSATTQPWTIPGLIPDIEILNFTAYLTCFLIGTTGNSFALHFFLNKKKDLATIIYIFITSADLLVSVLMLPVSLPFLGYHRYMYLLEKVPWFCNLWGLLWYCCVIQTVFLVAVVSITRCICITFPLARLFLNKKLVIGIVVGYLLVIMCQATIPFWVGHRYYYYAEHGICTWENDYILSPHPTAYKAYSIIIAFEMNILILPITLSSVMTVCVLNQPRSQMSQTNRSVTVTIVCFTLLYVIFNLPICLVQFVTFLKTTAGLTHINLKWLSPYGHAAITVLSVGVNSALNPCVYVWRTRAFRQHVIDTIRCRRDVYFRRSLENSMAFMMRYTNKRKRKDQVGTVNTMASPSPTKLQYSPSRLQYSTSIDNRAVQRNSNGNHYETTDPLRKPLPNRRLRHGQSLRSRLHDTSPRVTPAARRQSADNKPAERPSLQRLQSLQTRSPEMQSKCTDSLTPDCSLPENNSPRKRASRKKSTANLDEKNAHAMVTANPSFTEEDEIPNTNFTTNDELPSGVVSPEYQYPFQTTFV